MARSQVNLVNEVIALIGRGNPISGNEIGNRWDGKRILEFIDRNNREQASKYNWTNLAVTASLTAAPERGAEFESKYGIVDASSSFGTYYPFPSASSDSPYPDGGQFTRLITIYDDSLTGSPSIYKTHDREGGRIESKTVYAERHGIWYLPITPSATLRIKYIAALPDLYTDDPKGRQYSDIYVSGLTYLAAGEFCLSDSGDIAMKEYFQQEGMDRIMEAIGINAQTKQKAPTQNRAYRGNARSRNNRRFIGYGSIQR